MNYNNKLEDYDTLIEECELFIKAIDIDEIAWGLILNNENKDFEQTTVLLSAIFAIFINICHKRSRGPENLQKNITNNQEEELGNQAQERYKML